MIVALCSAKGAPGVTTAAALLAVTWPRPSLLIEADPSGGSLVARWAGSCDVSYEPGLISLAATRDTITASVIEAHSQPIADRARLLAAPPHPRQVRTALASVADRTVAAFACMGDVDAIVDCGRIDPTSPAMVFVRRGDVTLLVVRPRLADVAVAEAVAAQLRDDASNVALICVGDGPYHPSEVARHLGLPLAGVVAEDPRAAESLAVHGPNARGLTRSWLWRTVSDLSRLFATPAQHLDGCAAASTGVPV